jgi:hypothetical protein
VDVTLITKNRKKHAGPGDGEKRAGPGDDGEDIADSVIAERITFISPRHVSFSSGLGQLRR